MKSIVLYSALAYLGSLASTTQARLKDANKYHPCLRPCRHGPPMECRYNFTLEYYVTMGRACAYCNPSDVHQQLYATPTCQCVLADGFEHGILTINRMMPGPSIQVCKGDTVVVDVYNHMEGQDTTIHWHGLHQRGTPYYDGVPFVTQCPIPGGNAFRYRFKAEEAGTHFYHSHSGVQKLDGIYGSIIIRVPPEQNPHRNLYDEDLPEHAIILSDYLHSVAVEAVPGHIKSRTGQYPDTFLINGLGRFENNLSSFKSKSPYTVITVSPGKRYRLRLMNALSTTCDAQFTIENHTLTAISTDGGNFEPITINTLVSFSGEKFDAIVHANQRPGSYWIQVWSEECFRNKVHQLAILQYEGHNNWVPSTPRPTYDSHLARGRVYTGNCDLNSTTICITDLRSIEKKNLVHYKPNAYVYLPYELLYYKGQQPFVPNTYKRFIMPPSTFPITGLMAGISFKYPSSPLLSQSEDVSNATICNQYNTRPHACSKSECICTHIMNFAVGDIVEIMLVDYSANRYSKLTHPFHLHGHSFQVMALGTLLPEWNISKEVIGPLIAKYVSDLRRGKITRPVWKDTVLIPHNGYAIIRVKFDNPGYWFFHCHFVYHVVIGMNMVIRVGDQSDFPPLPQNFPRCGNFLPGGKLDMRPGMADHI